MRTSTAESNKAHYAALKIVEDAVKSGVKIQCFGITIASKSKRLSK
jgi:hypothetical protein